MCEQTLRPYPTALLNPCADPIFKSLFTTNSEESHQALTSFLSDLVGKEVTDVVLQPNELPVETLTDKQAEFDITCKIQNQVVNIEMQGINIHNNYGKRTEYHVAHLLNHYTPKGGDWEKTPQAFQISVLNFIFDKEEKNCFNHYLFRNEHGRTISQTLNIIFLELPKVEKLEDNIQTLTAIEMWGKFFLYANKPEKQTFVEELAKENRGIQMAVRVLQNISQDEANWYRESSYWMRVSDEKSMKNAAEKKGHEEGFSKGLKEGHAEGLAEGLKEGLEQGLAEGLAEGLAKGAQEQAIASAKNMLIMELGTHEQIAKAANLPLEKIEELAKEVKK